MSIFSSSKRKKLKKRQVLCKEVEIFTQVHFVRERNSEKYKYNTLSLKFDPDRIKCEEWYENHGNPDTYSQIITAYMSDSNLDANAICDKFHLGKNYFETLRSNPKYNPSKGEAVILSFVLQLSYEECRALLKSAGYALTNSDKSDLIIRYFLENHDYSISDLNYCLDYFEQPNIKNI